MRAHQHPDKAIPAFLQDSLGMSFEAFKKTFESDTDWALVIKLHAYVEASLNVLLVRHFNDARLEKVIGFLDISDRRRGKLAFVRALALLPKEYRSFIQSFSELRNEVAHNVKNVDFDLKAYVDGLDSQQFKKLAGAICVLRKRVLGFWAKKISKETAYKNIKKEPRHAFLHGTVAIMMRIRQKHQLTHLLEQGKMRRRAKSSPKAK